MQFKNPVLFVYKTRVSESKCNKENTKVKSESFYLKEINYEFENLKVGIIFIN